MSVFGTTIFWLLIFHLFQMLDLQLTCERGRNSCPGVDFEVFCTKHTLTHLGTVWMNHAEQLSDRQRGTVPGPAAPAPPLLSCPGPEQPLNSLLPQHSTGGKQSAPEV